MKYIVILICLLPATLNAQIQHFDIEKYQIQVKQPDEFMQRFNGEIDKEGHGLSWVLSLIHRQSYILHLFDKDLIEKAIDNDTLKLSIENFIADVIQGNHFLRFTSQDWFAKARCSAQYLDKPEQITYTMGTHTDSNGISKWNILGANAHFLMQSEELHVQDSVLSPISQNLNFTKLSTVLNKPQNEPSKFAYSDFKQNNLSIALFLSRAGFLKLNLVEELTFHFLDVDGWIFTVKNFERDDDNAGWLISNVRKATDADKIQYRIENLGLDEQYNKSLKAYRSNREKRNIHSPDH